VVTSGAGAVTPVPAQEQVIAAGIGRPAGEAHRLAAWAMKVGEPHTSAEALSSMSAVGATLAIGSAIGTHVVVSSSEPQRAPVKLPLSPKTWRR